MIDEIKKTFKKRVKEHEWIDDKTTKHVFEKVSYSFLDITQKIFGGLCLEVTWHL